VEQVGHGMYAQLREEMFENFDWGIVILTAALYTDIAVSPMQNLQYTHEESLCGWV